MIDNAALKACPFCGGKAKWRYIKPQGYVFCVKCGTSTGIYSDTYEEADCKPEAIAAWNRRAEPANEPLTLDELREMHGEPVWVATMQEWRIVLVVREDESVRLYSVYNSISAKSVIDNDGRIYRRKPEPEGGAR